MPSSHTRRYTDNTGSACCIKHNTQGNMGVRIKCLDPTPDAPASWAAGHVVGHFRDAEAIKKFVTQVCVGVRVHVCTLLGIS